MNPASETPLTIALDGPAASGKSTVAAMAAERLGWLFFDTGAMYRAITYLALARMVDLADGEALGALARGTLIDIDPPQGHERDGRQYTVRVGDEDITWKLRERQVDQHVSTVSAHPAVRAALKEQQRRIGLRGRVIMVGRDIGTVVLPEAPVKIFLDATVEERAQRRHDELLERDQPADYEQILTEMRVRDEKDRNRATAPLRPAPDAFVIDSNTMSIEQVVNAIIDQATFRFGDLMAERQPPPLP